MKIINYHFHLYYPLDELERANEVMNNIKRNFNVDIGRLWDRAVGPHPIGSCQITVPKELFEKMTNWLLENRNGVDVFIHAVTGDDLLDHTDYVMWIGEKHKLNLDVFTK